MCHVLSIGYASLPSDIAVLQTVGRASEAHRKQDRRPILPGSEGSGKKGAVEDGWRIHG